MSNEKKTAACGVLYGVGVGPGDPELLTFKAVNTIRRCPVVAAPQTARGHSLAFDIAAGAVDMADKHILWLSIPMTAGREKLRAGYDAGAAQVISCLDKGQDVALLSLGDAAIYSSYAYIAGRVRAAGFSAVMIPGVPSFCAAAAALHISLTKKDEPLCIVPAGCEGWQAYLDLPGSKVLMKSGRSLPAVCRVLEARGLADRAALVQNCGLPGARAFSCVSQAGAAAALDGDPSYLSLIIVRAGSESGEGAGALHE